jgi:thioredoxin-related protein
MSRSAVVLAWLMLAVPLQVLALRAPPAWADAPRFELLFVERSGCPWCARFEREIGPIYGKTDVGQAAPMRKASLDAGQPKDVALDEPVRFTPTFVLLREGREVGRIVGYMNDAAFWGLLEKMLADQRGD